MDIFLSFLNTKLVSCCRIVTVLHWLPCQQCSWTAYWHPHARFPQLCVLCPQLSTPLNSLRLPNVYLRNNGASIFAGRRNCMMRSCACLLGKEALAYIITHSLSSGGSSPHRTNTTTSQPVPPSFTSLCLDLPDDLHNNGGPSCSRSLSAQQTPAWAYLNWASQIYDNFFPLFFILFF